VVKSLGNNIRTRPPDKDKKQKEKIPWQAQLGKYLGITMHNGAMIVAGSLLGWYLDKKLNTSPFLLILGVFGGAVAGFYYLIRALEELHKHSDE